MYCMYRFTCKENIYLKNATDQIGDMFSSVLKQKILQSIDFAFLTLEIGWKT